MESGNSFASGATRLSTTPSRGDERAQLARVPKNSCALLSLTQD
jgi:hypothetical protein